MTDGPLNCLNCKAEVSAAEAKFFEGVFCCAACHELAERFYLRGKKELHQLLTMQKEAIRIALIEGTFHFGSEVDRDVSKTDLLRAIVQLEEVRRATRSRAGADDPGSKPVTRVIPSDGLLPGRGPVRGQGEG